MEGYTIRCARCSSLVQMKQKTKTPKYCGPCRNAMQDQWRKQISKIRKARTEGHKIEPLKPLT